MLVDVAARGFSSKDSLAFSFALAIATVRNDVCAGGAGDLSGTVDGDLVPSAKTLMIGSTGVLSVCSGEATAAAPAEAMEDGCDALIRLRGVYGFAALLAASLSLSSLSTFAAVLSNSLSAILDSDEVSTGVAGLGGTLESTVLNE